MDIKLRRALLIFFIIIFITFTPLIIYYAQGYRIDWHSGRIVKTGALSIDSYPSNATIYLDGSLGKSNFIEKILEKIKNILGLRKLAGTTPSIFHNLTKDKYEVKVEKKGYWPWIKKLEIEKEKVTFAEDINLFLKKPQIIPLYQGQIEKAVFNPTQKKIIFTVKEGNYWLVKLLDLNTEKEKLISQFTSPIQKIIVSPSANKVLVVDQSNNFFVLNLTFSKEKILLNNLKFLKQNIEKYLPQKNIDYYLKWDNKNDNLIYLLFNNKIYQINLTNKKITLLIDFPSIYQKFPSKENKNFKILNFLVKNGYVYFLNLSKNYVLLEREKTNGKSSPELIAYLPISLNYSFIYPESDYLNIFDKKTKTIRIINPRERDRSKVELLKFFAQEIQWSKDEKKILYQDGFEIGFFTLIPEKEKKPYSKEVISRYSKQIKKAIWYFREKYVIFNLEKDIYAIELDGRDKRNLTKLISSEKIIDFFISNKKDFLYFIGKFPQEGEGIYKIKIQ